jgi:hypothetical protein
MAGHGILSVPESIDNSFFGREYAETEPGYYDVAMVRYSIKCSIEKLSSR